MRKKGIKQLFGSPYHPNTQGLVEKFNDMIFRKIQKLSDYGEKDWDDVLVKGINAYNISFNRSISCSPHEIIYNLSPLFKSDIKIFDHEWKQNKPRDYFKNRAMEKKQVYEEEFKGKYMAKNDFAMGNHVAKYKCTPAKNKLDSKWELGFIVKKCSEDKESFIVSKNGCDYRVNKIHLKKDMTVFKKKEGDNVGSNP